MIDQLLGNIGWKDRELRHLGCNTNLAKEFKLASATDIIGLKDEDLSLAPDEVLFHRHHDQLALKGQTVRVIHRSNENLYLILKKPLLNEKQQINGVIYQCQQLNELSQQFTKIKLPTITSLHLSKRELQCLLLLLKGKTSKQIALSLNLSKRTIDFYIDNIKLKFGVITKSELIIAAIEAGYLHGSIGIYSSHQEVYR